MAGIGFKLQKLVDHGSYTYNLQGFFFATFLIAGPWITTITIISLFAWATNLGGIQYDIFRTSIVYFYAFSLIFTGFYQMPLTRFLSDELYNERLDKIVPTFIAMILVVSLFQGTISLLYSLIIPLSYFYKALFVSGSVVVALLWLAGIFLGCLRDFEYIGFLYVLGGLISLAAGIHLEPYFGMEGTLAGFILGQLFTLIGISWRIIVELGQGEMKADFACLGSLKEYPLHLLAGIFFSVGIWIDKFIFWLSNYGESAVRGLYFFQPYDVPLFLAYVCMIPGLGIFLTRVETDFYRTYRAFYRAILDRKNFHTIARRFEDIDRTINYTAWELIRVQGAITLIVLLFTPEVLQIMEYPDSLVTVLRWGIAGAFFQLLFLVFSLMLLYFEFRKEAMWSNLTFLIINTCITLMTVYYQNASAFGCGYFFSTIAAAALSWVLLKSRTRKLIFHTFMSQKMPREISEEPEFIIRSQGSTAYRVEQKEEEIISEKSDQDP